jgi:hypothetical protein
MKTRSGIWHSLAVMAGAVFSILLMSSGAQAAPRGGGLLTGPGAAVPLYF